MQFQITEKTTFRGKWSFCGTFLNFNDLWQKKNYYIILQTYFKIPIINQKIKLIKWFLVFKISYAISTYI